MQDYRPSTRQNTSSERGLSYRYRESRYPASFYEQPGAPSSFREDNNDVPEEVPASPERKPRSYTACIVIPLIMMVFAVAVQLLFGIFDVILPGKITEDGTITGNKRYVSIIVNEASPTGYRMTSDNSVLGNVYYTFINGRCLFCVIPRSESKGSSPVTNYKLLGKVQTADSEVEGLLNKISGDLNLTSTSLSGTAYPFIISHVPTEVVIDTAIAVILIIALVISIILLIYGIIKTLTNKRS